MSTRISKLSEVHNTTVQAKIANHGGELTSSADKVLHHQIDQLNSLQRPTLYSGDVLGQGAFMRTNLALLGRSDEPLVLALHLLANPVRRAADRVRSEPRNCERQTSMVGIEIGHFGGTESIN